MATCAGNSNDSGNISDSQNVLVKTSTELALAEDISLCRVPCGWPSSGAAGIAAIQAASLAGHAGGRAAQLGARNFGAGAHLDHVHGLWGGHALPGGHAEEGDLGGCTAGVCTRLSVRLKLTTMSAAVSAILSSMQQSADAELAALVVPKAALSDVDGVHTVV